jgi:hypothetical protein
VARLSVPRLARARVAAQRENRHNAPPATLPSPIFGMAFLQCGALVGRGAVPERALQIELLPGALDDLLKLRWPRPCSPARVAFAFHLLFVFHREFSRQLQARLSNESE